MAKFLKFNGSNQLARFNKLTTYSDYWLRFKVRTFSSSNQTIMGVEGQVNDALRIGISGVSSRILYRTTFNINLDYPFAITPNGGRIGDGAFHLVTVRKQGFNTYVSIDGGVELLAISISYSSIRPDNFGRSTSYGLFDLESLEYGSGGIIGVNIISHWDANASDTSAGNPVLIDTVGGNNAVGVNMPTDGSAWGEEGGSGGGSDTGINNFAISFHGGFNKKG